MGGFATTLLTLSLALMGLRGVTVETINVGNLCFVAGLGLIISAQWAIVRGDTFSYTVLTAFGGSSAPPLPSFFSASSLPLYDLLSS